MRMVTPSSFVAIEPGLVEHHVDVEGQRLAVVQLRPRRPDAIGIGPVAAVAGAGVDRRQSPPAPMLMRVPPTLPGVGSRGRRVAGLAIGGTNEQPIIGSKAQSLRDVA